MFYSKETEKMVREAKAQFPEQFTMLGNRDKVFRISLAHSYVNDAGEVMLYTEVKSNKGEWLSYAKGTAAELNQYVMEIR